MTAPSAPSSIWSGMPLSNHVLSLDLCRGLAAIVVMFYHTDFLYFDTPMLFQRGYLCVDFFFLLSGYVIASSYDRKIAKGLTFSHFLLIRLARLWPLAALATVLSFIVQLPRIYRDIPDADGVSLMLSFLFNFFLLPSPASPHAFLFPFNGSAWSIFFEIIANMIYAAGFGYLTKRVLLSIILVSAAVMVGMMTVHNTLDVGMTSGTFALGFPRVLFSFFLGILIMRLMAGDYLIELPQSSSLLAGGLLVTATILCIPKIAQPYLNGIVDLLAVSVIFPVLLMLALRAQLRGWPAQLAWLLGGISYSVYILQTPLMIAYSALPQILLAKKIGPLSPWSGIVFLPIIFGIAYVSWVYFERPAQRWLKDDVFRLGRNAQPIRK